MSALDETRGERPQKIGAKNPKKVLIRIYILDEYKLNQATLFLWARSRTFTEFLNSMFFLVARSNP